MPAIFRQKIFLFSFLIFSIFGIFGIPRFDLFSPKIFERGFPFLTEKSQCIRAEKPKNFGIFVQKIPPEKSQISIFGGFLNLFFAGFFAIFFTKIFQKLRKNFPKISNFCAILFFANLIFAAIFLLKIAKISFFPKIILVLFFPFLAAFFGAEFSTNFFFAAEKLHFFCTEKIFSAANFVEFWARPFFSSLLFSIIFAIFFAILFLILAGISKIFCKFEK